MHTACYEQGNRVSRTQRCKNTLLVFRRQHFDLCKNARESVKNKRGAIQMNEQAHEELTVHPIQHPLALTHRRYSLSFSLSLSLSNVGFDLDVCIASLSLSLFPSSFHRLLTHSYTLSAPVRSLRTFIPRPAPPCRAAPHSRAGCSARRRA